LFELGFALKRDGRKQMPQKQHGTPLETKIEQMLIEARVIIPRGQALLGFQLMATLITAFSELPVMFKYVHCAGLCAVVLSVVLLMTPAAVHRIRFDGEDDPAFFRIGSSLVIAGAIPLAVGIAADVAVVFFKATESTDVALAAGVGALALLLVFWLAYPFWRRSYGIRHS
jgi:hypothetical protein